MKKTQTLSLVLGSILGSFGVHATSLSYSHKYEDVSKGHTDEIGVSHHFASGPKLSAALKFEPNEEDNGDAGIAFYDERWHETKLKMSYPFTAIDAFILEPGFSWARKQDSYKYKPYLKLKYKGFKRVELSSRYRYEVSDYAYKPTRKKQRYDIGLKTTVYRIEIGYTYSYYRGDSILFNHTKNDYEQKVSFSYPIAKACAPYIELTNESVSKSSDRRQTEIEIGLKYKI